MSNFKCALIIELLWIQSRHHGGFGGLSPPNKVENVKPLD